MPAYYAHDRFGLMVADQLTGEIKDIVEKYYTQFAIGLQGPDIFFFYRPLSQNKVVKYGNHLHDISVYPFMEHACNVIRIKGRDSAYYAYLLGFVCHFVLDSECHPYVEEMVEETGVQHLEIEEEFEKYLLREDGEDPLAFPLAELVPATWDTARIIAPFYAKSIDDAIVKDSLDWLKFVKGFFTAPGRMKQGLINSGLRISGKYGSMKGLMHQRKDNPACDKSNRALMVLFDGAISRAVEMMASLDQSIVMEAPLDQRFDRNFL